MSSVLMSRKRGGILFAEADNFLHVVDVDNPESSTESVGIGAGVDASVMTLACRTWQECWVN